MDFAGGVYLFSLLHDSLHRSEGNAYVALHCNVLPLLCCWVFDFIANAACTMNKMAIKMTTTGCKAKFKTPVVVGHHSQRVLLILSTVADQIFAWCATFGTFRAHCTTSWTSSVNGWVSICCSFLNNTPSGTGTIAAYNWNDTCKLSITSKE